MAVRNVPQFPCRRFCGRRSLPAMLLGVALAYGAVAAASAQTGGDAPATAPAQIESAQTDPAQAVPAAPQPTAGEIFASGLLPRDLTPVGMFMSADVVVKVVMLGLVFASLLTWTIWLAKSLELVAARRGLRRAEARLATAPSLDDAAREAGRASAHVALLVAAVHGELRRSAEIGRAHV